MQNTPVLYLDGDKVTRAMQLRNPGAGDIASQMPAIFDYIIETILNAGRSLAVETNFHSNKILERVQAARALGYRVELYYITLDSVHLAHQRVRGRLAGGGLGVSNTEILKRYQAGIRMVGNHYALFDCFVLIDNSLPGQPNTLAEYAGGGPVAIYSVPDWAKEIFPFLTTQ